MRQVKIRKGGRGCDYGFEVSAFLNLENNFMKFRETSFTMFHEVS